MTHTDPPASVRSLEQRIRNVEGDDISAIRRRIGMALVVVGQMLPEGVIKGGSAMALRYGYGTRFTTDLDAARVAALADFRASLEESIATGWAGFTGRLVERTPPRPAGVPAAYVMKPYEVKLNYRGRPWCTVQLELGHNEIGDAENPEYRLSAHLSESFTELGLPAPSPVRVMRVDHQIAQKLHAMTVPDSERAHDLVDLQIIRANEDLNLPQVLGTCRRLFAYRRQHEWPPTVTVGATWDTLYAAAAEGTEALESVEDAVAWANDFVREIDTADDGG